jgi:Bacterial dnaA protein helix-turn-helix
MGTPSSPAAAQQNSERLLQLVLHSQRDEPLIRDEADVTALGSIAARMLFWCGGAIYAWRSVGIEMRFALQVKHASLGSMAHHLSGAYASHMRQVRKLTGSLMKHYTVVPHYDAWFLDDLVMWLHRSGDTRTSVNGEARVWTADAAYLDSPTWDWIDTARIFSALSSHSPGPATYRRRKFELIHPAVLEQFMRRPQLAFIDTARSTPRPSIERIARLVADHSGITYPEILADTRKRAVSKARAIATVLATRNGATAAAAAKLFNRSRSTLIEQVDHYRVHQPEIFVAAEKWLDGLLADAPDLRE